MRLEAVTTQRDAASLTTPSFTAMATYAESVADLIGNTPVRTSLPLSAPPTQLVEHALFIWRTPHPHPAPAPSDTPSPRRW